MSNNLGVFDRDEAFWQEIRALPSQVKERQEIHEMLLFKSQVASLNRNIEDAIISQLAQLEKLLFSLHRDESDAKAYNELGYAWISVKQARQAVAGDMPDQLFPLGKQIDVWKVSDGSTSFYTTDEAAAKTEAEGCDDITISRVKMARKVYENLPEFDGF